MAAITQDAMAYEFLGSTMKDDTRIVNEAVRLEYSN